MTRDDIIRKLDELAEAEAQKELLASDKKRAIEAAMPPEVVKALQDIDAEFDMEERALNANIADLQEEIKAGTLQTCETMRGKHMMAVWQKGRVSWDCKALDGYMAGHPEIRRFRREGEPSVSIRRI